MAVVTLAREVGSGGQTIARLLGERLGYAVFGRAELLREADRRGMPLPAVFAEFADEERLAARAGGEDAAFYLSVGELEFDAALRGDVAAVGGASFLEVLAHERRSLLLTVASLTYELAARDRVILVGAGSQYLLGGRPGLLRVKIVAPRDVRAARLGAAYGLSEGAALAAVDHGDREQRDYNRAVFDADWDQTVAWDLIVNSELFEAEAVARLVLAALEGDGGSSALPQATKAALAAAGAVNRAFLRQPGWGGWIQAEPDGNRVVVFGEAAREDEAAAALAAATAASTVPVVDEIVYPGRMPLRAPAA